MEIAVARKQKGQVLVEFALCLPMFLMLVFGIIYSGMLFYDYSTLSNAARSVARERAITEYTVTDEKILERYVRDDKFVFGLVTSLYTPDSPPISIVTTEDDDVVVTVGMSLGSSSAVMDMVLPKHFNIVYHMRKDVLSGSFTSTGNNGNNGNGG